jgi:8-oxo-dGTP pyrophosphatase MutT (NUDIX family)
VPGLAGTAARPLQQPGEPVPSGYEQRRSDPHPTVADALRPTLPEEGEKARTVTPTTPPDGRKRPQSAFGQGELRGQAQGSSRRRAGPAARPRTDPAGSAHRVAPGAAHRLAPGARPVSSPPEGEPAGAVARVRGNNRTRLRNARATSAGGIVVRHGPNGYELVLGRRTRERNGVTWTLPKGQPNKGETLEETALREVAEETGLAVRIVRRVGQIDYFFVQSGTRFHKTVHFFLMEPTGGDLDAHDREFEEVRWFNLAEAEALMSYPTEREILEQAATEMTAAGT